VLLWAALLASTLVGGLVPPALAQARSAVVAPAAQASPVPPVGAAPPADYVIGPDDVLMVVFWRDKEMTGEVSVRPDGKISLPLINDVHAAGLTPDQLRLSITDAASKFVEEPNVTVVVRTINSRRVFVTGQVNKQGGFPLAGPTTVLQLIAMAGGLLEYADPKHIMVMRTDNGKAASFRFNYNDVTKGKNLTQNIELKPGDTLIVP
jgi:polysaccharide biosynthesis/export protein